VGGVVAGEITLVTGSSRSGKTCFAIGFAARALERGEGVCFVASDLPESVLDFAERNFHVDFQSFLRARELTLLSFGAGFQSKVRSLGDVSRPLEELGVLLQARNARHLVFDTIDPILAAADLGNVKLFVKNLVAGIRSLGVTCLATSLGRSGEALRVSLEELSFDAAGRFELNRDADRRTLLVHETAWSAVPGSSFEVDLVPREGIVSRGPVAREYSPLTSAVERYLDLEEYVADPLVAPGKVVPLQPPGTPQPHQETPVVSAGSPDAAAKQSRILQAEPRTPRDDGRYLHVNKASRDVAEPPPVPEASTTQRGSPKKAR
jgi:circadian clock protein KaiC